MSTLGQKRLWTRARRLRLAWSILISLSAATLIVLFFDPAGASSLKRGDFPAFYAAGKILLHGDESRLYDYRLHQEIQNEYWASLDGEFYAFSYPPFVALLYEPLAQYPPETAKLIVVAAGFLILGLVLYQAEQINPEWGRYRFELSVLLLAWAPLLSALVAGQNTIYTVLLLLIVARLAPRHSWTSALIGGSALTGLFFKPHYAVLPFILLLLARRFRIAAVASVELLLLYLLTAVRFGYAWPLNWITAVRRFAADDLSVNQHLMVSLSGFFRAISSAAKLSPLPDGILSVAAIIISAAIIGLTAWRSWKIGEAAAGSHHRDKAGKAGQDLLREDLQSREGRRNELTELILISGPVIALASPHTLYYDATLALLPLLIPSIFGLSALSPAAANSTEQNPAGARNSAGEHRQHLSDRTISTILSIWCLVFLTVTLKDLLPAQPLAILLFAWVIYMLRGIYSGADRT